MTPAQLHMQVHPSWSAGWLPIIVCTAPGIHGEDVIGMQGMGVSTPRAAEVAAATCGLASDMHIPNGAIFTMGL